MSRKRTTRKEKIMRGYDARRPERTQRPRPLDDLTWPEVAAAIYAAAIRAKIREGGIRAWQ